MRVVVDMEREDFINSLKYEDVKQVVEFYLEQEYNETLNLNEFLHYSKIPSSSTIEIMDTMEFDVDTDFARLLDKYNIPYSRFILIDEDTEVDDFNSIEEARYLFPTLDIYSRYQSCWVEN